MAIDATDWTLTRSTSAIRYIGDDHGGASPTYATILDFKRWLGGLGDDLISSGDDEHDMTDPSSSDRKTDNFLQLLGSYNIDDNAAEHLYDGSIIQGTGGTEEFYDGIVNFGNADVQIQIIQNGAVLSDDWWNQSGAGLNPDAAQNISHRFLIKTRTAGADIDGRRLIGTNREYEDTYGEFKINGTARGNNVLALKDGNDINNNTVAATVAAYTDVFMDRTDSTTTVNGVNSTGQAVLNVVNGAVFTAGDFIMTGVASDASEYQIISISVNALTLNRNLVVATAGAETVYISNYGFTQVDVNNDTTNEDYAYGPWDRGAKTINQFTERIKWLTRAGSTEYFCGLEGELARGITHELTVDTATGTFAPCEGVSWTGGTGHMYAINSPTAGTTMWIQLLTGVVPTDGQVITGGISTATVALNVTVTDREGLLKTPIFGQTTGTAIIGSFGFVLQTADLASTDSVTDLTNAAITPPINTTFTVNGALDAEDSILATNDNAGDIDYTQLTLLTSLTADNITSVVTTVAIPTDTPATGFIRVQDDNGRNRQLHYSSYTGSTFTIDTTNGEEDFLTVNATQPRNVFITYLDKIASAPNSFTGVYLADRTIFVRVRDGGVTPIKDAETTGVWTASGGSATINRVSDL